MKTKIWVVSAFVLTFAAGVLTGAIIVREYSRPLPPRMRAEYEPGRRRPPRWEALKSQLNLSEAQSQQVAKIVARHEEQLRQHFSRIQPFSHEIVREMTMQIDSVLTPEQRRKFHEEILPPPLWRMPHRSRKAPNDSLGVRF
jgi:Spy/CpxP family protein refolding chaperone